MPLHVQILHLHPDAHPPERQHGTDAGWDLRALERVTLPPGGRAGVPTGLAIALPPGWEAQVRPRSGLALRRGLTVLNAPGTIDAGYRGEIRVILHNTDGEAQTVESGERIAQVVFKPVETDITFERVERLPNSDRGEGGFGHTGCH